MRITIEIPDDVYREAEAFAASRHVSVEELFDSMADNQVRAWRALKAKPPKASLKIFVLSCRTCLTSNLKITIASEA